MADTTSLRAVDTTEEDLTELEVDFRSFGSTGLKQYGGLLFEEGLPELRGQQGQKILQDMLDNDSTISTINYLIDKAVRQVDFDVEAASSADFDREAADHVHRSMHDMENTWTDTVAEMISMAPRGFSLHEIVLKRCMGDLGPRIDPSRSSKYADGRVGWLGFPIRAQDTITRWLIDDHGRILGAEQSAPPSFKRVILPIKRCLLLRTTKHKNNPEGRSIFRGAYKAWAIKRTLENLEAVGAERDIVGFPVAYAPPSVVAGTTKEARRIQDQLKRMVVGAHADRDTGFLLPMAYDDKGRELYRFELMKGAGTKMVDTDKVIQRWDQRICMSVLADFLLLGQGTNGQGSWAMHTDKTQLFANALEVFLDIICEEMNRVAVPELMRLNRTIRCSEYPKITHGKVGGDALNDVADYLTKLVQAGMTVFPNPDMERFLLKRGNLPIPPELGEGSLQSVEPKPIASAETETEVHDDSSLAMELPDLVPNPSPENPRTARTVDPPPRVPVLVSA